MKSQKQPETLLDDNPEWTAAEVQKSVGFEGLSATLRATLSNRGRGQQKDPIKQQVSVRYSPEVINKFKSTGKGWQVRMDKALQDWLKEHDPSDITV